MHARAFAFSAAVAFILSAALAPVAHAHEWAESMVDSLEHDFGTVAQGSDNVHKFEITNKFKEDIVLLSVRSSCGCTSPSLENQNLKTWQKGFVVARFNSRNRTGYHHATLTLEVEVRGQGRPPYRGQVQLQVQGTIRGDIVFEPGAIQFGQVEQGDAASKSVAVRYSGHQDWKIVDVRSANDNLEVVLTERYRRGGRVEYDLQTRLKPTAKPGLLKEQLVLVTSENTETRVPIDVEGQVIADISVSPAMLVFGKVQEGQAAKKRMMVRGKKPFRITAIECQDACFKFTVDDQPSDRHVIEVSYVPNGSIGDMKAPIVIKTDRGEDFEASCTAFVTVEKPASDEEVAATPQTNLVHDR
ncbi:MAG: DUF1573 domain-containing protein [Planctomycetales bacterium]|nr:DUF1573 domain-containing protein [Planctomycetales bacterium]